MEIISDLHTHTIFSDGRWTPEELIEEARNKGIRQIAVADHNNLQAIQRAKVKAKELGINFVSGVEIDVKSIFEGEIFHNHILGYNFDENKLGKFIAEIKGLNKEYFEKLIDSVRKFIKKGEHLFEEPLIRLKDKIDLNEIRSDLIITDEYKRKYKKELDERDLNFIYENKFLGPEIIHRFIKNNLVKEPTRITDKYPTTWKKIFAKNFKEIFNIPSEEFYKTPLETISEIKNSGGVTILAHPFIDDLFWSNEKKEKYLRFVDYLIKNGLNGLEIYYYANDRYTIEEQEKLNNITKKINIKNNLISTYGSDCHGGEKVFLGKFGSEEIISFDQ